MAEPNDNGALSVKTSFGEIAAKGTTVMLVLILFAIAYIALMEHAQRSEEHESIMESLEANRKIVVDALHHNDCLNQLAIFQGLQPRGVINWRDMPASLYLCIPRFMIEPRQ